MMRTNRKAAALSVASLAAVLQCPVTHADQSPSRKNIRSGSTAKVGVEEYKILLSLANGWNTSYTGLAKTTVTFINSSAHRLEFSLSSPFSTFIVEYKPVESQTYAVLSEIPPKSSGKTEFDITGVPMSAEGLYRVTAVTNIPDASELDGPTNAPKVVRTFALNLRSNSIVMRRTATGFVTVNADMGKLPAPPPK